MVFPINVKFIILRIGQKFILFYLGHEKILVLAISVMEGLYFEEQLQQIISASKANVEEIRLIIQATADLYWYACNIALIH